MFLRASILKFNTIPHSVYFYELYRVSPDPVEKPLKSRGRGRAGHTSCPPPAHVLLSSFFTKFFDQFLKLLFAFREFTSLFVENVLNNPGCSFALYLRRFHFPPKL